jgi:methyl-accepting chemotaxis protein
MKNLKIRTKLIILATVISAILVFISGLSIYNNSKATRKMDEMYNNSLISIVIGGDLRTQTRAIKADFLDIVISKDQDENNKINEDIEKRKKTIKDDMVQLKKLSQSAEQKKLYSSVNNNLKIFRTMMLSAIDMANNNKASKSYKFYTKNEDLLENYQTSVRNINDYNSNNAKVIFSEYKNTAKKADTMTIVLSFIGISILAMLSLYLIISINKVISSLIVTLNALKNGDLKVLGHLKMN